MLCSETRTIYPRRLKKELFEIPCRFPESSCTWKKTEGHNGWRVVITPTKMNRFANNVNNDTPLLKLYRIKHDMKDTRRLCCVYHFKWVGVVFLEDQYSTFQLYPNQTNQDCVDTILDTRPSCHFAGQYEFFGGAHLDRLYWVK